MKQSLLVIIAALLMLVPGYSQQQNSKKDTSYWDLGNISSLTISQSAFRYWVAGGDNSLAINAFSKMHANYKHGKHSWMNNLDLAYGMLKQQDKPFRKTDDKIEFNSQYGLKAFDHFYYTMLFNFRTQFTPGYDYQDTVAVKTSNFMSPGYLIFSVGLNYQPEKHYGIYASIVSGKMTIVTDPDLYMQGAYGVEPGKKVRYELGAYAKMFYNKEIIKNLTVNTTVSLFSNYLHNPQNIDVNLDFLMVYKATKYITINFRTQAIYDDDVKILINPETGQKGPRLQLMEIVGLGITLKLPNK